MPSSVINSDDGAISGTSGLKTTGGNDGLLNIQSNGTTIASVTTSAFQIGGNNISAENSMGFRNRIINGDMRIDQRGGTITVNNLAVFYGIDRFSGVGQSADGVFTMVQDTSAPTGFVNSLKVTVTTADASIGASQYYTVQQLIEGTNVSDLAWGSASAKTVTLSFWVRSSVTGTFGGSLRNANGDRSYPFTYSISAANTWEQKTVTITGDTTGTWLTTTGVGIRVNFGIGTGSSGVGTAGSWAGANYFSATGATNLISTLNATWYITGVQLEVGSVATPFERRPYTTELQLCERYYQVINSAMSISTGTTAVRCSFNLRTYMRSQPSMSQTGVYNANYPGVGTFTQSSVNVAVETGDDAAYGLLADFGNFTGLTAQRVYMFRPSVDGDRLTFSAEL